MPFGFTLTKTHKYRVLTKDTLIINVLLLDKTLIECSLRADSLAKECFVIVVQKLRIKEPQYFGLRCEDPKNSIPRWLDLDKPIKKQLPKKIKASSRHILQFGVMFFVPSVSLLSHRLTRYFYYLHVKNDVLETHRILCTIDTAVTLASYALQAEFGDYQSRLHSVEFVAQYALLPRNLVFTGSSSELLRRVMLMYRSHCGMQRVNAEVAYLQEAEKLDGYGVEYVICSNNWNQQVALGISVHGLTIRSNHELGLREHYQWSEIRQLSYTKCNVYVSLVLRNKLRFTCDDMNTAQYIYSRGMSYHQLAEKCQKNGTIPTRSWSELLHNGDEFQSRLPSLLRHDSIERIRKEREEIRKELLLNFDCCDVPSNSSLGYDSRHCGRYNKRAKSHADILNFVMPEVNQHYSKSDAFLFPKHCSNLMQMHPYGFSENLAATISNESLSTPYVCMSHAVSTPGLFVKNDVYRPNEFVQDPLFNAHIARSVSVPALCRPAQRCESIPQYSSRKSSIASTSSSYWSPKHAPSSCDSQHHGDASDIRSDNIKEFISTWSINGNSQKSSADGILSYISNKLQGNSLLSEFSKIPLLKPQGSFVISRRNEHFYRNRNPAHVPYDDTRVNLDATPANLSGYINASWIKVRVLNQTFRYIAAQWPLPDTLSEWWSMLWENKAGVLVSFPGNKPSMVAYLPPRIGERMCAGDIVITRLPTTAENSSLSCYSVVYNGDPESELRLFHLTLTCVDNVPDIDDTLAVIEELRSIRDILAEDLCNRPVVVHCIDGCGATGLFILLEIMQACTAYADTVDMSRVLTFLRFQRPYLVQTLEQYAFVYKALYTFYNQVRLI